MEVRSPTRSEETYKMLGYLENFIDLFQTGPFCGALCFLSNTDLFTEVVADGNHRIVLVGAHVDNPRICAFGGRMDTLVSEWLSQRQLNDAFWRNHGAKSTDVMSRALRRNFLVRANSAKLVGSLAFPVLRAPGIRFILVLHEHGTCSSSTG